MTESIDSLRCYSDRLSPIFVRDLRQGLRGPYFVFCFIALHIAAFLGALSEVLVYTLADGKPAPSLLGGFLALLLSVGFGLVLPLSLFGALQAETGKGRNIELLLTSSLTRWQIVFGKFLVASSLSALLLISILPYFLLRYFLGNVELTEVGTLFGSTLLLNATMNSLVIGASSFRGIIGRLIVLGFFWVVSMIASTLAFARHGLFGGSSRPGIEAGLAALAVQFALIVLGLQLGRSRIKLFESPIEAPNVIVVFILALILPVSVGIATAAGGAIAVIFVGTAFGGIALLIDRGPGKKYQLKGLQP